MTRFANINIFIYTLTQAIYKDLIDAGFDDMLAKHYAHLFIRDPLVIFGEMLELDDEKCSDHFEVCFSLSLS